MREDLKKRKKMMGKKGGAPDVEFVLGVSPEL